MKLKAQFYYSRDVFPKSFLSVDEDGELAKLASPRTSSLPDLDSRIVALLKHFKPGQGVALTVEELCPGGLDPTDGIAIAQAFEKAGAEFIIASGGTSDFPALKNRRSTQTKKDENHAWLSSACWLIGRVKIPVFAQGSFEETEELVHRTKVCGLSGLVHV
ncbi:MAG: hypothetical protein WCK49_00955 [Myxococcaceae bacterium]